MHLLQCDRSIKKTYLSNEITKRIQNHAQCDLLHNDTAAVYVLVYEVVVRKGRHFETHYGIGTVCLAILSLNQLINAAVVPVALSLSSTSSPVTGS